MGAELAQDQGEQVGAPGRRVGRRRKFEGGRRHRANVGAGIGGDCRHRAIVHDDGEVDIAEIVATVAAKRSRQPGRDDARIALEA